MFDQELINRWFCENFGAWNLSGPGIYFLYRLVITHRQTKKIQYLSVTNNLWSDSICAPD